MKICLTCHKVFDSAQDICPYDKTRLQPVNVSRLTLKRGTVFNNKYNLLKQLGHQNEGGIWLTELENNQKAVLKILSTTEIEFEAQQETISRFFREIYINQKLHHPNLALMYEYGFDSNNIPYILNEYTEGETLGEYIEKLFFPQAFNSLINIFINISDALFYAHSLDILHRDIKPANIIITPHKQIKIIDFGAAKILKNKHLSTITNASVYGTPEYMSPEQITGKKLDARTDIYSLGILMYQAFTKTLPFNGYIAQILMGHLKKQPKPPKLFNSYISDELNYIIMKCINKEKSKRYQSVYELKTALQHLL